MPVYAGEVDSYRGGLARHARGRWLGRIPLADYSAANGLLLRIAEQRGTPLVFRAAGFGFVIPVLVTRQCQHDPFWAKSAQRPERKGSILSSASTFLRETTVTIFRSDWAGISGTFLGPGSRLQRRCSKMS